MTDFIEMPKIARLSRDIIVTEKLDGTNASIYIPEDGSPVLFGSRTRWITPADDNYGLKEKRFSLFNVGRWGAPGVILPDCVSLVPLLLTLPVFDTSRVDFLLESLRVNGSVAVPGWMKPEGVVVYHKASNTLFKKTLDKNDGNKGAA